MRSEAQHLIEEMSDAGIHLWIEDGKLKFRAPSGAMTAERASLIKKNRDSVIAAVSYTHLQFSILLNALLDGLDKDMLKSQSAY